MRSLWVILLFKVVVESLDMENLNMSELTKNQEHELMQLVEEQIQNYIEEVKQTLGLVDKQSKKKRSADFSIGRVYGAEVLSGFQELFVIPCKFPQDIILFSTSKPNGIVSWFAATLESDGENPQTSLANNLVLYRFDGTAWLEFCSVAVKGGIALASLHIQEHVYIVVAEYYAGTLGQPIEGSSVYMLNENNYTLQYVQLLNTKYASDVIAWERSDMNEVFVAVTTSKTRNSGEFLYSTQSIVYHWLGGHFDIVDYLPTYNPHSIAQFNIGSFMFLAVANFQDNYGNTNIDSEIFRYDLNSGKFVTYQKLRTNAAVDIKYFCFESSETIERFLVVANYFEEGDDGSKDYETNSIIYKLSQEKYFIPFQSFKLYAVKKWIPIFQNMGEADAFVLLAVCEDGVVSFQYDGWRFVESSVQYSRSWFGKGISSIRPFQNGNQTVFTLANKNNPGTGVNIFNATFVHDSRMDEYYQGMEDWCQKILSEVQGSGIDLLMDEVEQAPKQDDEDIVLYSSLEFTDVVLESVKTDSWFIEGRNVADSMTESLNLLNLELTRPLQELEDLERAVVSVFVASNTIHESQYFEEATINCTNECNFDELHIETLNGVDVNDFLQNVVIDKGILNLNEVAFENLAILTSIRTLNVNGHPADSLVDWSQDNIFSRDLVVNGSVKMLAGLDVSGTIDGVNMNENSILVLNPEQPLKGSLNVHTVEVESLNVNGSLNGYNIGLGSAIRSQSQAIQELNTSELLLEDRLLNGVDFGNLNLMALRTESPEQLITGTHFYAKMEADEVILTGRTIFPNNMTINSLNEDYFLKKPGQGTVKEPGRDGKQLKPGNLNPSTEKPEPAVLSSIRESLSETMRSAAAKAGVDLVSDQRVDSFEIFENDFIFNDNLKIDGRVIIIDGSLITDDLLSINHDITAKTILEEGLRLDETNIPNPIVFRTPFNVEKLSVETINGVRMESLVANNSSTPITITGHKTFVDGIKLEGGYRLNGLVNEVNVSQLVSNTLQTEGDQFIDGSLHIGSVHTNKLNSKEVYLNNTKWENTTLIKDGVIQLDSVQVNGNLSVDILKVQGTISGIIIEDLLKDSLFVNDKSAVVTSFKNFTSNISVEKMQTSSINKLDMNILTQAVVKSNIWNSSELVLDYPLRVEHLIYTGNLDGIDSSEFGEWLLYEGDQDILGQQTVKGIEAEGGIVAKTINNVNVDRLLKETRHIDSNETINNAIFNKKVYSKSPVHVEGKVQGLDLSEDAVLRESSKLQSLTAHKTFLSPVTINGTLYLNGKVNGFNLKEFCLRIMSSSTKFTIRNGSAMFEMEPFVSQSVNGYSLKELLNNTWFLDENITIDHPLEFSDVQFHNTTLKNTMNNILLEELSRNYLSKTMDQVWDGEVRFIGGMTMQSTLTAPSATVGNFVAGININKFKDNVLLDGEDQVIDGVLDFGNIEIEGTFNTTGLVNDLDLLQDVMRIDVPVNIVTGHKQIFRVEALEMDMPPRTKIQDVDIKEWDELAVKKTGGTYFIEDEKIFSGSFHSLSNIRVDGLVNGKPFDAMHIMYSSSQQTVTGIKQFDKSSRLYVKDLELSALLNGINMTDFFVKQLYTDGNATITGSKTFSTSIKANRVNFAENNDLLEMEQQLKTPLPYDKYQREVNKLNLLAETVQKSLRENSMFLRNYHRHTDIDGAVIAAVPVKNPERATFLVVIQPDGFIQASLTYMKWNSKHNIFNNSGNGSLYLSKIPTRIQSITLQNGQVGLMIESEVSSNKDATGVLESFLFLSNFSIRRLHRFGVPSGSVVLHFEDRKMNIKCYVISHSRKDQCSVYCYTSERRLYRRPQFQCLNITQASVLITQENVYVVTISLHKIASIYMWNRTHTQFNILMHLPFLNPVSVDTISYSGRHYVAIANQHLVGNITAESINVYRLNEKSKRLTLFQELFNIAPSKIEFSILPSSELVLYVLSENRATPFSVYVYRGIVGFEYMYTDATLPLLTDIASFTDEKNRHFVILTNKKNGVVLQAIIT